MRGTEHSHPSALPVETIKLNFAELKLLKKLYRKRTMPVSKAKKMLRKRFDSSAIITLVFKQLIVDNHDGSLSIIKRGDNWIELNSKHNKNLWLPIVISSLLTAIGIIVSIIALLKP